MNQIFSNNIYTDSIVSIIQTVNNHQLNQFIMNQFQVTSIQGATSKSEALGITPERAEELTDKVVKAVRESKNIIEATVIATKEIQNANEFALTMLALGKAESLLSNLMGTLLNALIGKSCKQKLKQ